MMNSPRFGSWVNVCDAGFTATISPSPTSNESAYEQGGPIGVRPPAPGTVGLDQRDRDVMPVGRLVAEWDIRIIHACMPCKKLGRSGSSFHWRCSSDTQRLEVFCKLKGAVDAGRDAKAT